MVYGFGTGAAGIRVLCDRAGGDFVSKAGKRTAAIAGYVLNKLSYTRMGIRAISSVGLERLPYTQEVIGSNPISPTGRWGRMREYHRY